MLKKILVPTDASEFSQRALKSALELARKFNAEVELLFVMNMPIPYDASANIYIISPEQIDQEGERVLKTTLEGMDTSEVTITNKKLQGKKPAAVILEEVKNKNIDLVVMGSHGRGAIAGSLLGSVSQHVLHGVECSVLIVK
ncbi:MAG TPA: universal stress protein [Desulfosporosinus sp.]|nr:universal stress protein [Desulfosporosinus sp.]